MEGFVGTSTILVITWLTIIDEFINQLIKGGGLTLNIFPTNGGILLYPLMFRQTRIYSSFEFLWPVIRGTVLFLGQGTQWSWCFGNFVTRKGMSQETKHDHFFLQNLEYEILFPGINKNSKLWPDWYHFGMPSMDTHLIVKRGSSTNVFFHNHRTKCRIVNCHVWLLKGICIYLHFCV